MLTEEAKQSAAQIAKKNKAKSETANKGVSPARMKELAHHDARREVRSALAAKIEKGKTPSKLTDANKERLNAMMDQQVNKNKIEKLANYKFKEKQLKQEEKDLKKQAKNTKDDNVRQELEKKAAAIGAKLDAKKDTKEKAPKEKDSDKKDVKKADKEEDNKKEPKKEKEAKK
jgi:hypothetical protein